MPLRISACQAFWIGAIQRDRRPARIQHRFAAVLVELEAGAFPRARVELLDRVVAGRPSPRTIGTVPYRRL